MNGIPEAGHARAATPEELALPWRVGTSNPFSVYVQLGAEPSKTDDPFVGSLVTPHAAAQAVRDHNEVLTAEAAADFDLIAATNEGAKYERDRIAVAAAEMATVLSRPGLGNGPAHGEQVRMVRLDDLLGLLSDDSGDGEQA